MSDPGAILDMVERFERSFGPVGILVDSAGGGVPGGEVERRTGSANSITGVALPVHGGWTAH